MGPAHTHNFSVNGKSGKTDYNLSFGYLDQSGMMKPAKKDDFQRYNGSVRVGTDVNNWLRVYGGQCIQNELKAMLTPQTQQLPTLGSIFTVGDLPIQ
ncbi:hypothetical protein MASR1M46_19650 [Bacteroidales bacterium]